MKYNYRLPCCKDKLQELRNFVFKTLQNLGLPELEISQMVLAVDEICANLIIHSNQCNKDKKVELVINVKSPLGITFEFIDHGEGFNILDYKEPCLHQIIKEKKKGGMGLLLVNRIMDKVEFDCDEVKKRNICRLHKKIKIPSSNYS